uniref:ATPase V1 complex subunit H C-terminal domain-containing protein n=1 Tax=Aureoumbra lagunensis TaxID=44058 RepID=A0A7S3NHF0_9STRA|mmetsp:Transcript_13850/g.16736  ORF Transcript_13850/g.16736 Transcript_13850/m.16736 type:complete len:244 (+) Transcript_13850:814-1545(+)
MVYELIFCLWTLSLEWSNSSRIVQDFHAHATIETLVDQVASAPREKVMRVSLATLRNLCSSSGTILSNSQGVAAKMIKAGLVKNLRTLRERPWTDPDVKEDVEHLSKVLSANYRELSTFERYLAEVDSGELDWGSLCHSEAFWKDNAKFAEANDFALIKKLVNIVSEENQGENDAEANKNIAIACSDLGDFVRFYPNGKAVIKHLGAKDSIMKLIDHPDPDVQRHALQCVSKLLVTNWQFVKS